MIPHCIQYQKARPLAPIRLTWLFFKVEFSGKIMKLSFDFSMLSQIHTLFVPI